MFNKKYKKVIELLDSKIEYMQSMFNISLADSKLYSETVSDEEWWRDYAKRGGRQSTIDINIANLEVLCELKREILKEIEG